MTEVMTQWWTRKEQPRQQKNTIQERGGKEYININSL